MTIKSEVLNLTTPPSRLMYSWMVNADTKYEPKWKVTLLVPQDQSEDIASQLTEYWERFKAALKQESPDKKFKANELPFGYETIQDGGEEIAAFVIKASMKVGGINKKGEPWKNIPPVLFDEEHGSQPVPESAKAKYDKIGPGSIGQASIRCQGYSGEYGVGIKLQPQALMIRKFVEYSSQPQDAAGYGFDTQSTSETPKASKAPVSSDYDF